MKSIQVDFVEDGDGNLVIDESNEISCFELNLIKKAVDFEISYRIDTLNGKVDIWSGINILPICDSIQKLEGL